MAPPPEPITTTTEFKEAGYIPITQRPEWLGTNPLRPPPASNEVVAIQTDPDHADLLAYFWAAMNAGERSERVINLTEEIILGFNSAHFSVWAWRWECLLALGMLETASGVITESSLMRRVATDNPKNYQLWNHRRKFALHRGALHVRDEMEFSAACLVYDAKNYHAWAHRQAMIKAFGAPGEGPWLWGEELTFTERLLRDDIRNNSAWTQRYFVAVHAPESASLGTLLEVYDREIDFVRVKLGVAPHNEGAWGYLRALTFAAPGAPAGSSGFEQRVFDAAKAALEQDASNVPALESLAEYYVHRVQILSSIVSSHDGNGTDSVDDVKYALDVAREAARELYNKLTVADPARAAYYKKRGTVCD